MRITQELFSQNLHIYSSRPQTHEEGPDGNGDKPSPAIMSVRARRSLFMAWLTLSVIREVPSLEHFESLLCLGRFDPFMESLPRA